MTIHNLEDYMDNLKKYSVPFLLRDRESYSNKIAIVMAATEYQAALIVGGTYISRDEFGNSLFDQHPVREAIVDHKNIAEIIDMVR